MPSLRDALEAALVEDPDDLATHRAYADYLQEQGDPRGELIQVQLALEDPERTAEERRALERRERELLAEHEREWLGILADELLGPEDESWESLDKSDRPYEIAFARGWLDRIVLHRTPFGSAYRGKLGRLLCRAPESRLLRKLVLDHDSGAVKQLIHSPFLTNLRIFQLGPWRNNSPDTRLSYRALPDFVARLPHLDQLHLWGGSYDLARLFALPNLSSLRTLHFFGLDERYPLEVLAENPALANLHHLLLTSTFIEPPRLDLAGVRAVIQSPHLQSLRHLGIDGSDVGDVGCTEIVTSGILKRLKVLYLCHGEITDTGARILADCPDLQRLEYLDIDRNGLTQVGIDALRRVLGDKLRADD